MHFLLNIARVVSILRQSHNFTTTFGLLLYHVLLIRVIAVVIIQILVARPRCFSCLLRWSRYRDGRLSWCLAQFLLRGTLHGTASDLSMMVSTCLVLVELVRGSLLMLVMLLIQVIYFGALGLHGVLLLLRETSATGSALICWLWAYSRVVLVVTCHGSLVIGASLSVLKWPWIFGREFLLERVLRNNALLVQRIIDSFWGSNSVGICLISTLLLFVNILAETGLLLRWQLVSLTSGHSYPSALGPLRYVLLLLGLFDSHTVVHHLARCCSLDKLSRLVSAQRCGTTLATRSLVLLHDVLEYLLIKVSGSFVVLRALLNVLRPSSRVWHHKILLVARSLDLRLHGQVLRLLSCLLRESEYNFIDDLVGWIWGLIWSWLNQIWTFMVRGRLIWIVIVHRVELLAWRCNRSVDLLGCLRV